MIKRKCSLCDECVEIFEDGDEDTEVFVCGVCNANPKHRKR